MSVLLPETRARLQSQFSSTAPAEHGGRWDDLWKEGFVPWDKGTPNPALVELLEGNRIPKVKAGSIRPKALVPGCGKGYDILLLSAFGYDAYGLDFSSTALTQARENAATIQNSSTPNPVYATRNPAVGRGIVKYIQGDFFKEDFKKEIETKEGENWGGKFDLLYDYTFGCALPPSLRSAWSLSYSKLLSPTGHLICVEFPSAKPENLGGPPWALSAKVHWAHLRRPGEDLGYAYDKYAVKDAAESEERWVLVEQRIKDVEEGKGLMRVEHFKPDVTHNVGYNEKGEVEDMVSVWRQKGAGGDEKL